ncbi:MAG: CrcB family protein [Phycisphaerales bacterium]|nr:CrcB family protein [Phycisphaerales bacterium]
MLELGLVAFGGALGAAARFVIGLLQVHLSDWPGWTGVLIANLIGSLLIGLAAGSAGGGPWTHAFLMVGVCGALTTFSALALDLTVLIWIGAWRQLGWCLGLSLAGGIPLVVLGQTLGHAWFGVAA